MTTLANAPPIIEAVTVAGPRPFWSVMIPCFNSASTLARTIESVLQQDPGPVAMQIEVIDDANIAPLPVRRSKRTTVRCPQRERSSPSPE